MDSVSLAPHSGASNPLISTKDFAARLGVKPWTIRNGADHNGTYYRDHAVKTQDRCYWPESYVAACVAARQPDPDTLPRKEAARLLGVRPRDLAADFPELPAAPTLANVVTEAKRRGFITEHLLMAICGLTNRQQLAFLIAKDVLPGFDDTKADGTWTWDWSRAGVRACMYRDDPGTYLGPIDRADMAKLTAKSDVPGFAELESFARRIVADKIAGKGTAKEKRMARVRKAQERAAHEAWKASPEGLEAERKSLDAERQRNMARIVREAAEVDARLDALIAERDNPREASPPRDMLDKMIKALTGESIRLHREAA